MNRLALLVILLGGLCIPAPAAPRRDARSKAVDAREAKLHGKWTGQGPCDGGLTIRADGTYERTHQGPAGINSAGTWKLRWDALPPTLVLTCKSSDDEAAEGQVSELKVVRLDDEGLEFTRVGGPSSRKPTRFGRAGK